MSEPVVHLLQVDPEHEHFTHMIFCPGCECGHGVCVGNKSGPNWTFNGDLVRPTFSPSLLLRWRGFTQAGADAYRDWVAKSAEDKHGLTAPVFESRDQVCHSFINDGKIQFLDDCTHALRGQIVPLEPF